MFCDVSGFTALCEAMAAKGRYGDEHLAHHLNSYFEQVRSRALPLQCCSARARCQMNMRISHPHSCSPRYGHNS
jgi:hypothetical protein